MQNFVKLKTKNKNEHRYEYYTRTGRLIYLNFYHDMTTKTAHGAVIDPALSEEKNFSITGQEGYHAHHFIGTMIKIFFYHVNKYKEIEYVSFYVNKSDKSRISLYDRWVKKHGGSRSKRDRRMHKHKTDHIYYVIPVKNIRN